jgi:hypothetical protein
VSTDISMDCVGKSFAAVFIVGVEKLYVILDYIWLKEATSSDAQPTSANKNIKEIESALRSPVLNS